MKFSDIRIFPVANAGNLLANGKVVLDETVEVSFRVMNGKNGQFISLPAQKVEAKDGSGTKYYPEVRFVNEEAKKSFDETVMAAFTSGNATPAKKTVSKSAQLF
jgi:DNA-binding cell septation regulator SpoVG